jgi:hypothetical protein
MNWGQWDIVDNFLARQHTTRPCLHTHSHFSSVERNVSPICPLCTAHTLLSHTERVSEGVREKISIGDIGRQSKAGKKSTLKYTLFCIFLIAAFSHFLLSLTHSLSPLLMPPQLALTLNFHSSHLSAPA